VASDLATAPRRASRPIGLGTVVGAAAVIVTAFRVGALPGGQVAWDLLFAAFGASVARGVRTPSDVAARLRRSLAVVWPAAVAALVLAVGWVLTRSSTRNDSLVRGEALGLFGGYGNWQQAARGPSEADVLVTPLQGVWPLAVAVQLLLVWAALAAMTRRRAAARPGGPDPIIGVTVVAAGLAVAWGIGLLVLGVSGTRMTFGSDLHAPAFLLGAVAGAGLTARLGDGARAALRATVPVLAVLLAVASVAMAPDSSLWTGGGAVVVPVFAGLLVVAVTAARDGQPAASRLPKLPFDPLVALVSFLLVQGAAVALVAGGVDGALAIPARAGGLVLAAAVAVAVTTLGARRSWSTAALERRRVLVPPAITVVLVIVLSVTGAFHWSSPHPVRPSRPASGSGGG
jgi:peptidoglycan/LPS O-acetylase OafA/YrhL